MSHNQTFKENLSEIKRLLEIHVELTGDEPGRRANVEVLNKSGIVLLVACWEAFVEDLATSSFDFLLSHARDHKIFSAKVRTLASKNIRISNNHEDVWLLAGRGWENVLKSHRDAVMKKHVTNFHTPRAFQVDTLFEEMVGYKKLSSKWYWQNMSKEEAINKLEDLVTLRGSIAHRVSTSQSVTKSAVNNNASLIARIVAISSNELRKHIFNLTKQYPWEKV